MMAKIILLLVLGLMFLIVFLQNIEMVTFQVFFWEIWMSRAIFFFLVLIVGFVLGFVFAKAAGRKRRK